MSQCKYAAILRFLDAASKLPCLSHLTVYLQISITTLYFWFHRLTFCFRVPVSPFVKYNIKFVKRGLTESPDAEKGKSALDSGLQ